MKLDDIKQAVRHAAESELKRSFYNACAVLSRSELDAMCNSLFKEVYEADEGRTVANS